MIDFFYAVQGIRTNRARVIDFLKELGFGELPLLETFSMPRGYCLRIFGVMMLATRAPVT